MLPAKSGAASACCNILKLTGFMILGMLTIHSHIVLDGMPV